MLFSRDKDDDDDFFPTPNYSNLASIFGSGGSDVNPSLTYTAPKQPRRQTRLQPSVPSPFTTAVTNSSSKVILAKTVQTFKMVEGSYVSQGRVGAALVTINMEEGCAYQLILYRDKRNHLCCAIITREFNYHIQPKNYCTFYDKQSIIWSILFDDPIEMVEFNQQVTLTRWRAGDPTTPLISQDLWNPDIENPKSAAATVGDTVELSYSFHNINNVSQTLDEGQNVSVEVESTGWKAALAGVLPGTKRAIVMQPFMLGDLNPKEVAYSSPVLVKVTIVTISKRPPVELQEELKSTKKERSKSQPPETERAVASPGISPKSSKADLITRMARMGQALPFKTAAPSDSDETEDDQAARLRSVHTDRAVPKVRTRVQHNTVQAPSLGPLVGGPSFTPPVTVAQQLPAVPWNQAPYMVNSMFPATQLQSPMVDTQSQFNMFLSEIRTTNSELRMGLTRLTDKVEALQTKVDDSAKRPSQDLSAVMEKLVENDKQLLQVLTAVNNIQLTSQSTLRTEPAPPAVVQPCQKCLEHGQQDLMYTSLLAQVKELQDRNEYLLSSNSAQKDAIQNAKIADKGQLERMEALEKKLEEERSRVSNLNKRLQDIQSDKDNVLRDLETMTNSTTELLATLQEKQMSIDRLEQALKDSEATKIEEVRRNLQEVLDPKPVIGDHLKKILNVVYRMVKVQFEPQKHYDAVFIQSVLAETIKGVTLEYLENGNLLLEGAQERIGKHKSPSRVLEQSQSAPLVGSTQQDQHSPVLSESKLSVTGSADMPSETEFLTPKETSAVSLYADSVSTLEAPVVEEATTSASQKESNVTESKEEVETAPSIANSDESSEDAFRPQPPPPPLFDEEDNEDDWINS